MKTTALPLLTLLCILASPLAQAESIDLATLSCGQLMEIGNSDGDAAASLIVWIDGYLSGVTGDTRFDDQALGSFTEKLMASCQRTPKAAALDIAKAVGIQ